MYKLFLFVRILYLNNNVSIAKTIQTNFSYTTIWALLILLLFTVCVGYFFRKNKSNFNIKSITKNGAFEPKEEQQLLYLLFLGFAIPAAEITLEFFKIRTQTLLFTNCLFGVLFILSYYILIKFRFLNKFATPVFVTYYLTYFLFLSYHLIYKPFDLGTYVSIIIAFFLSYYTFKTFRQYLFFITIIIISAFAKYCSSPTMSEPIVILFCAFIVIFLIHIARHMAFINTKNRFLFANEIVNRGTSLTIATNKKGELSFCSDQIKDFLGYTPEEVLGLKFWELTEDQEFTGEHYHNNFIDNRLHVRRLKCKNGQYKYIQWKDKKFSEDLIIGIGQDITEQIEIQNRYKNLIENATDIIFETDLKGKYTYINQYSEKILGYNLEELYKLHFKDLIRKDYKKRVLDFYNHSIKIKEFSTLIFPATNKFGETVWLSQNISAKVNESNEVIGYSAIARDITLIKELEIDTTRKEKKIKKYNDFLKTLTAKSYNNINSFETILPYILENVAQKVDVNRVGFWEYQDDKIVCQNQYINNEKKFESGFILLKEDYPNYFEKIQSVHQIVISDLFADDAHKEFFKNYFKKQKALSLLDTPIYLNGKLIGILCIESTTKIKYWHNEDINFARSISDFIAIAIETNQRVQAEARLAYKNEMLSIIAKNSSQFLNNKSTEQIIKDTLNSIGLFINVDRLSFFENIENENIFTQKFRWLKSIKGLSEPNDKLKNVPHKLIKIVLDAFKEKKYYASLVSEIPSTALRLFLEKITVKSILFFPIYINKNLCGILAFDDSTLERIWTEEEISILQILINNLSSAIERNENEKTLLESEKRFRLLADNIPGTVYLSKYDEKWTKLYLNDEILNLTGYPKEAFLQNKIFFSDLIHPEDYLRLKREINDAVFTKQKIHSEYRIIHKNGSIVWVEEFGDTIYNGDQIDYIEGIFIDITQKKATDDAIKAKEYAEAANKAKSEFLANMSHEIKTPLNGIIGFTNLLKNTKLEEIQKNYMNTINQSANSLMEIINDILDFSKIESGKLVLDIKKYNVAQLANQVIELIKYDSNTRKLQIEIFIDSQVPTYAWFDIIRIKQVLVNLLSNAIKFTNEGSVKLSIEMLERLDENHSNVRFSVTDTGIGIKEEFQNIIFDAFSQGDNSTTRRFGGTGLGLTISNKLLAVMNSKLQLISKENEGSTFYFDVILKTSNENSQETTQLIVTEEINDIKNNFGQENYKILIVEDNKINMLLAKTLVKQIIPNCSIYLANNGKEAVEKFEIIQPDLILMDVQMPEMNGYESTVHIRKIEKGKHIPIIAITAGTVMGEKEKCLESGMNDYTSKPIIKDTLEKIITKWLKI